MFLSAKSKSKELQPQSIDVEANDLDCSRLAHLYLSPLNQCNLNCKICYTAKSGPELNPDTIIRFLGKYQQHLQDNYQLELETVTFCGGEIFLSDSALELINWVTNQGVVAQIITNGTVDKLEKLINPGLINLIVSLDGLAEYHDLNRGEASWNRSVQFIKKALNLGFQAEVFSVVTRQNLGQLDQFEERLTQLIGQRLAVSYHPRKPVAFLESHPVDNRTGLIKGFDFLTKLEWHQLWDQKQVFPPRNLDCSLLSIFADGKIYSCCEGTEPIGQLEDELELIITKFLTASQQQVCGRRCSEPSFACGLKDILNENN
ncbi:MAG: radical SAM protein [Candidatus Pacebacteria bacterium]|nr:radical SAM protein [Candidatus Paceibacterota bacterium]